MTMAAAALLLVMGPAGLTGPQVVIPERAPIFWFHGDVPRAELMGFDVSQAGKPVEGPPFTVQEGQPLELTLYWRPLRSEAGEGEVGVNLRSPGVGSGPGHYRRYPLRTESWQAGRPCTQKIVHELAEGVFSGAGFLNLFLTRPGATAEEWTWLYRAPAIVLPVEVGAP